MWIVRSALLGIAIWMTWVTVVLLSNDAEHAQAHWYYDCKFGRDPACDLASDGASETDQLLRWW